MMYMYIIYVLAVSEMRVFSMRGTGELHKTRLQLSYQGLVISQTAFLLGSSKQSSLKQDKDNYQ
jgi:hypothetical protein